MYENELFGGWEIVEQIGTGGFSKVYKIRKNDGVGGEYYSALKVITIPSSEDEYRLYVEDGYDAASIATIFRNQVTSLVNEFKLLSEFRGCTNIVSYEDHKVVPQPDGYSWHIFIRMELLGTLPAIHNRTPLDLEKTVKLGIDICTALILCEKYGIIHRDIKPQNIFVNKFGDYKLGDFGIARTMDHTTRATKIGTPAYMAPEVFNGGTYNSNVDIYSLGMVLYWLLNERRLPFLPLLPAIPTDAQNNAAQNMRLRGAPLPEPKNGTPALKAAVLKACSFDPLKRFQRAEDFKKTLEQIQAEIKNLAFAEVQHPEPINAQPSDWDIINTNPYREKTSADVNYEDVILMHHQMNGIAFNTIPQEEQPQNSNTLAKILMIILICIIGFTGVFFTIYYFTDTKTDNDNNNVGYNESLHSVPSYPDEDIPGTHNSVVSTPVFEDVITENSIETDIKDPIINSSEVIPTIEGIFVKVLPEKTSYYVGDSLDTTGLKLEVRYSNGTSQIISQGFSCSPYTLNTASSSYPISVKYQGYTTTFNISVVKKTQLGNVITFGNYEQDNNMSNGKEQIEWIVLDVEDDRVMLISRYCLDYKQFNSSSDNGDWENSTIRSWLNNDFYQSAFTSSERRKLISTQIAIPTAPSSTSLKYTSDKVFLLSESEVSYYYTTPASKMCKATSYAISKGAYVHPDNGSTWWWLRSYGLYNDVAARISSSGYLQKDMYTGTNSFNAVRPVIWMEL